MRSGSIGKLGEMDGIFPNIGSQAVNMDIDSPTSIFNDGTSSPGRSPRLKPNSNNMQRLPTHKLSRAKKDKSSLTSLQLQTPNDGTTLDPLKPPTRSLVVSESLGKFFKADAFLKMTRTKQDMNKLNQEIKYQFSPQYRCMVDNIKK